MRFQGFVGPSYTLSSVNYDCQRSVNLYPEIDELQTGKDKEVAALIGTPGLTKLATIGSGPIRGMWFSTTGVLYVVSGGTLYSVDSNWKATSVGNLNTIIGQVSMADNGIELVVVDGTYGYYVNMATAGSPTQYTFTVSAGQTASVGAKYTNNGQTFTVTTALTNTATSLVTTGTGDPTSSGSLVFSSGTGTGPITFSAFKSVVYNSLIQITDMNFLGADVVTYQDGYFIFNRPNSREFYLSDADAITFTSPALSSKEGNPDNIVSLVSSNKTLWLLGDTTMEAWFDTGDALTPFQYISGTLRQCGCAAKFSVVKMANTIFWLGKDNFGKGMVYMANGYEPSRISTQAVETAIQSYSSISDAVAFTYQENGHQFYFLTFPTGNATWVYDLSTGLWHERAYLNQGSLQRHRASSYAYPYNTHVVGDYSTGAIYAQSLTTYTDDGNPLARIRVTPHISQDMKRIFHTSIQLDIESGVGLDGGVQGSDPQAMLQWSNDGGHTWSNEHWVSFGKIGQTTQRAYWQRLGRSRNRVYRVMITDPVKVVIIGATLDAHGGSS